MLLVNKTLQWLDLFKNNITCDGAFYFAKKITDALEKTPSSSKISRTNSDHDEIEKQKIIVLHSENLSVFTDTEYFPQISNFLSIRHIDLAANRIKLLGCQILSKLKLQLQPEVVLNIIIGDFPLITDESNCIA